jgi:hypothetical protein
METIITYLDNMFARLPETKEVLRAKEELLATMEEKYNAYKREGKTENEAIGIVISEFGNIDELIRELGIDDNPKGKELPVLPRESAERFAALKRSAANYIALGVFLCISAPATLIYLMTSAANLAFALRIVPMFVMITCAVGLFILSSMRLEEYEYLEKTDFMLDAQTRQAFEGSWRSFRPLFAVAIAVGVMLCILSPVFVITVHKPYGVTLLLFTVAVAVFLFVRFGILHEMYEILLRLNKYAAVNSEENRLIGIGASIWWPLVTAVYLIWSFTSHRWGITWLVWPVAGLLFAVYSAVCSILNKPAHG